jgi:hypothetical protein
MQQRIARLRGAMAARGLDRLVVYGDREHAANIEWATGFDPRFEEALFILGAEGAPVIVAGNECLPYAGVAPMVAAGEMRVRHCASLSLISQPRGGERLDAIVASEVGADEKVGTAGWKYWEAGEVDDPAGALEVPALLADLLRARAGSVVNATDLFMHPGHGLRAQVDAAGIARLEHANDMAARALRRMVFACREGMTDFACAEAAMLGGLPLGCHMTFATGDRAAQGLSGPTGQVLRRGSPISFNICHWGANICRAGWVSEGPDDLPVAARDYLEAFVFPYVGAVARWFGRLTPGTGGGEIWAQVMRDLPLDRFGVTLNPGHLIGTDEWISSPVFEGSQVPIASGMAMQCDIIPVHPVYGSTRMEDGYAIAGPDLRRDLAAGFPGVMARIARRRDFMAGALGIELPETVLPLADTCGIVAPWLLAPDQVVTLI